MIKLYRLKDREVREVADDSPVVLRCLKRAGFVIGELPELPRSQQPVEEIPIPATEDEEVDAAEVRVPVMAKHAPVGVEEAVNPYAEMNMKELRAVAKEKGITVPFRVRTKDDIAAFLALEGKEDG